MNIIISEHLVKIKVLNIRTWNAIFNMFMRTGVQKCQPFPTRIIIFPITFITSEISSYFGKSFYCTLPLFITIIKPLCSVWSTILIKWPYTHGTKESKSSILLGTISLIRSQAVDILWSWIGYLQMGRLWKHAQKSKIIALNICKWNEC